MTYFSVFVASSVPPWHDGGLCLAPATKKAQRVSPLYERNCPEVSWTALIWSAVGSLPQEYTWSEVPSLIEPAVSSL